MTTASTDSDHATMLLTQRFEDAPHGRVDPITTARYSEICHHMAELDLTVAHLLSPSHASTIADFEDSQQIDLLLARSVTLGAKTEQWNREHIHTLSRTNPQYPRRLLQTMGDASPPVIYYVGNIDLFYNVAISVMMPPEAPSEIYRYSNRLGQGLQRLGATIATRVMTEYDKTLVSASTGNDSAVIGMMDYDFRNIINERKFRGDLNSGRLLLMTHNCPDSATPNCPETNASRIIGSIAGRTMFVDPGPPPQWHWADLMQANT